MYSELCSLSKRFYSRRIDLPLFGHLFLFGKFHADVKSCTNDAYCCQNVHFLHDAQAVGIAKHYSGSQTLQNSQTCECVLEFVRKKSAHNTCNKRLFYKAIAILSQIAETLKLLSCWFKKKDTYCQFVTPIFHHLHPILPEG